MYAGNAAAFSRKLLTIASVAAAFAPAAVLAQAPAAGGTGLALRSAGWYSGLSVRPDALGASTPPLSAAMPSIVSGSEANTGFKIVGGYQFSRHFAVEGRLSDFGRSETLRDDTTPAFGSTPGRSSGFRLDAVGIVPLRGGFSLFGKIGTLYSPARNFVAGGGLTQVPSFADPNPKPFEWNARYGLGASYDVSSSTGLHFKYERASSYVGDARIGDANVGIWSLGLIKRY